MTTPTDKFSTAITDRRAGKPFVLGKCNGHDLRGCPHGGGDAVWETNCNTWKGYHCVILCEKCADDLENDFTEVPESASIARRTQNMELIIKNIRTHYRGVNGCKRHKRDVMVSFMHEGDESVHDIFLTQEQAEGLLKDLTATLAHNADDMDNNGTQRPGSRDAEIATGAAQPGSLK